MDFKVAVEKDEDGIYCVSVPALEGCFTQGKTLKEALENAKEAIECYLESLEKDKLPLLERINGHLVRSSLSLGQVEYFEP